MKIEFCLQGPAGETIDAPEFVGWSAVDLSARQYRKMLAVLEGLDNLDELHADTGALSLTVAMKTPLTSELIEDVGAILGTHRRRQKAA